jgi:hypothetical protein
LTLLMGSVGETKSRKRMLSFSSFTFYQGSLTEGEGLLQLTSLF